MANEIKDLFDASTSVGTIANAGGLANAAGCTTPSVDNSSNRYQDLLLYVCIKAGASAPTANSIVEIYLVRSDADGGAEHIDDGMTFDAAATPLNAQLIGALRFSTSPSGADILKGSFLVHRPGPKWGVAIFNRCGQSLDATDTNHYVRYVGLNPEVA